jgi:hypothetical protein
MIYSISIAYIFLVFRFRAIYETLNKIIIFKMYLMVPSIVPINVLRGYPWSH